MIAPLSWLKDYVDIDVSAEELQKKLFSCGFEVEELTYLGKNVEKVVVGEITATEKHPNADKLTICQLDCGSYGKVQICTAATNVFVGAKVPAALDGATVLHEGQPMKIKATKMRGVESSGMMCSGEELGINDDFYEGAEVYGILILDPKTPVGSDIRDVVGLNDYLFDIGITANRPDCQCILGIAREVAAVLNKPLKMPAFDYTVHENVTKDFDVTVEAPDVCPRYIGHYVSGIKIGKSPAWMRRRLALCGLRSISNVVDITNFVLLEMGQPMHAFDLATLENSEIVVRRAKDGEKIKTLDDKEFDLKPDHLVICDGNKPVALAGIMGGANSEITENTKEVLFEAAKFARDSVRKTARALGQHSDSSARFEKGVDEYTTNLAMDRALHLIEELDCGTVSATHIDRRVNGGDNVRTFNCSISKINGLLGIAVSAEDMIDILTRLQFGATAEGDTLRVTVPAYREDIDNYPDIAEEVIRMYGYDHITPTFLDSAKVTSGGLTEDQKMERRTKKVLVEQGYFESVTYSFYSPKSFDLIRLPADAPERTAIKILNPIGEDLSMMRTILAPSMLENIIRNIRRGNEDGKLFEIANVYLPASLPLTERPQERRRLILGAWGNVDFYDVKGALEELCERFNVKLVYRSGSLPFLHPGITAKLYFGQKEVGYLGELAPDLAAEQAIEKKVYLAELDYELLTQKFDSAIRFTNLPKFPAVQRDLALVAEESLTCAEIEEVILHSCKAVTEAKLFDVYRSPVIGINKKSMAFSLTFLPEDKPLSSEDVDKFVRKILNNLKFKLNVELR